MTTVMRATDPAEFLGLVPALAGFTPRESIVLLPFHGGRTHGAMRMDLPDDKVDPEEFADGALRILLRVPDVEAVAVVVYTGEAAQRVPDGLLLPHVPLIDTLLGTVHDTGVHIVEALCVTPSGWGDYLEQESPLRPLREILAPPELPGIGDVSGDQLAGAALPAADLAERERVGRALRDLGEVLDRELRGSPLVGRENPQALAAAVLLDDVPAFAEDLLEQPADLPPFACATLLWCLNRPAIRDAILVQWATDLTFGDRALSAQLDFAGAQRVIPDAIGEVFLGRGARPDPDRLGCALHVVRLAAARAPRLAQPGALTAAAWLSWALGRSSHAGAYVEQALEIDPEHRMAALIGTMLSAGVLPEWALRRG
ncbi:DUF4192 family protein [Microbacterium sp. NPDC058345]|uniref:DUF4192 family protein n=1 Tax=Microbacterium sp. NPDC058345 TaxID=3346455 RepID=UPI0036469278